MESYVLAPLRVAGEPRRRLEAMMTALGEFYAGGSQACLAELFSVGDARSLFQERIRTGLTAWIAAIARVLKTQVAATPQRAPSQAVVRLEGALIVARALGSSEPFARLLRRLPKDLLVAAKTRP